MMSIKEYSSDIFEIYRNIRRNIGMCDVTADRLTFDRITYSIKIFIIYCLFEHPLNKKIAIEIFCNTKKIEW